MYKQENAEFQVKVVERSGLNMDGTYRPPAIHPSLTNEPKTDMKTSMLEAEMVMGGAVSSLLEKTGAFGGAGLGRVGGCVVAGGSRPLFRPLAGVRARAAAAHACLPQRSRLNQWCALMISGRDGARASR